MNNLTVFKTKKMVFRDALKYNAPSIHKTTIKTMNAVKLSTPNETADKRANVAIINAADATRTYKIIYSSRLFFIP